MAETAPLTPTTLSSTFMPYFDINRSASPSSTNTRQRSDFEHQESTPQLTFTSAFGEAEQTPQETYRAVSCSVASYPASELPFASEPALETELETELPPLKKLRSTRLGSKEDEDEAVFDGRDNNGGDLENHPRVLLIKVVKGILLKRETFSSPILTISPPSAPGFPESQHGHESERSWEVSCKTPSRAPHSLGCLVDESFRPPSRRSSSSTSTVSAGAKAVRFASGNGFFPTCDHLVGRQERRCCRPEELEGPVAAVMYLTHSAVAYDRSPIVVEKSLRLPPRMDSEECGKWVTVQCLPETSRYGENDDEVEGETSEGGLSLRRTTTTKSSSSEEADERWVAFSSQVQKHFLQLREEQTSIDDGDEEEDNNEGDKKTQVGHDADEEEQDVFDAAGNGKWLLGADVLSLDDPLGGF